MKKLSLTKTTAFVAAAITASFIVSANEKLPEIVVAEKQVNAIDTKAFAVLDTDSNGLLSKEEVKVSKNSMLASSFSKIDTNADASLSPEELSTFVNQAKTKI